MSGRVTKLHGASSLPEEGDVPRDDSLIHKQFSKKIVFASCRCNRAVDAIEQFRILTAGLDLV